MVGTTGHCNLSSGRELVWDVNQEVVIHNLAFLPLCICVCVLATNMWHPEGVHKLWHREKNNCEEI